MSIPVAVTFRGTSTAVHVNTTTNVQNLIDLSLIAFDLSARCYVWGIFLPGAQSPLAYDTVPDYTVTTAFILRRLGKRRLPNQKHHNRNHNGYNYNNNNDSCSAIWALLGAVIVLGVIVWVVV